MGQLATFMISPTNRRVRRAVVWLLIFAFMFAGAAWIAAEQVAQSMRIELERSLVTYGALRANIVSIFDAMDAELTASPCSQPYLNAMRRIAYVPDGISELFYAPDGVIVCTANGGRVDTPLVLGPPDVAAGAFGIALWLDRSLTGLGLDGLTGTIARRNDFALAIPPQFLPAHTGPEWMQQELVYQVGSGFLHRAGAEGVYAAAIAAPAIVPLGIPSGILYQSACDPAGEHCVAAQAPLLPLATQRIAAIVLILSALSVLAAWLTQCACSVVERYWSFEARFLRRFNQNGLVCAYQPLLNLRSDTVTGCEVLARWRDVDGTIVMPDQFLPIVEKHNLTERFTAMLVATAYADLAALLPETQRLQLNFNIFPRDLDANRLIQVFAPFLAASSHFTPVVELVETAEVDLATAQMEIDALREAGIGVYIDDFGAGYSSMHNLASLVLDGVKLDRSFAMAADDSVMVRMLDHAIELVHATGRALVVEGVETRERLERLRAGGRVDFAQGYGIARPLTIEAFAAFLAEHGSRPNGQPRMVA